MPLLSLYSSRQGDSTQLLACMDTCTTTNKTYPVASPRRGSSTSCPQGSRSTSCTPCIYAAHQGDSAQLLVCVYAHTATSILYPTASFVEEQQHMPLPDIYAARPGDSTQLLARAYACAATRKPGQLRRRGGAL